MSGLYWITQATAQRLQLKTHVCKLGDWTMTVADVPDYKPGRGLPPPPPNPCGKVLLVQDSQNIGMDGQFSGSYMARSGAWTFNYPARTLSLDSPSWRPSAAARYTPLGFQQNNHGEMTFGYPRITVRIAGQSIDMLLDTGATAHPTIAGKKASGTPTVNGFGVTSYIVHSLFDHWHASHPEWRVVTKGDDLGGTSRIIEVPKLEIAVWSVGPVWFTERPDAAFHQMMSSMMDKRIEGAIGGNVFRHFVMTIDYPHEKAYFRCDHNCKPIATPPPAP